MRRLHRMTSGEAVSNNGLNGGPTMRTRDEHLTSVIHEAAVPLHNADNDYDRLLEWIGDDTRYVLIGEAMRGESITSGSSGP